MNRYEIYCTEEQTRKAFELGAPIKYKYTLDNKERGKFENPTTEQMIGWLEEQEGIKEITICKTGMWIWGKKHTLIEGSSSYLSRQEATLAAIDAALEYLTKKNKK